MHRPVFSFPDEHEHSNIAQSKGTVLVKASRTHSTKNTHTCCAVIPFTNAPRTLSRVRIPVTMFANRDRREVKRDRTAIWRGESSGKRKKAIRKLSKIRKTEEIIYPCKRKHGN